MPESFRRLVAEALGTASLLAAIVGSGIVVGPGGGGTALFQHAVVVGLALVALILAFGPVSGAHLNPVVSVADAWFGGITWSRAGGYIGAQLLGAVAGVAFTNLTFGRPLVEVATTLRSGPALVASEVLATAGLVVVIFGLVRSGAGRVVAAGVGAYIAAAIVFTSSTSFANPAVTIARMLSDTYTGIVPTSVPGFLLGQALGLGLAIVLVRLLYDPDPAEARAVVIPQEEDRATRRSAPRHPSDAA